MAVVGFGVMTTAYLNRATPDPRSSWANGCIAIGPERAADAPALPGEPLAKPVRLRLLPAIDRTEAIIKAVEQAAPGRAVDLKAQLRPKLIALPFEEAGIDESSLQSGRLPAAGTDEVVAGVRARSGENVTAGNRSLQVVGRLKPDLAVLTDSFLMRQSDAVNDLFPKGDPSVHEAILIRLPADQLDRHKVLRELETALPSAKYTKLMASERLDPTSYYSYLAGLAVMLLGGSGALIGLYRWAVDRSTKAGPSDHEGDLADAAPVAESKPARGWLAEPLLELAMRPRVVWGVHIAYFGLVILGSILIYELPDVQTAFLSLVREAFTVKAGPLAAAGVAYGSGSIPLAALVTFVVNFFLGSLFFITLPSMLIPGSGVLTATLRSVAWGLILAPTFGTLAVTMLPHSGTMLLEGEGYILATIFGLLIPVHICQSSLGGTPLSRFGRVLLLNLKALTLVALVLAVAACYEATEVILMNR
jgi:hypothetical protein